MNALATTLCAILTALFPSARPNRVRAPSPLLFWTHFAQAIDEFNHLLAIWRATAQVAPPAAQVPESPSHEAKPVQSRGSTAIPHALPPDRLPQRQTDESFLLLFFKKEALASLPNTP